LCFSVLRKLVIPCFRNLEISINRLIFGTLNRYLFSTFFAGPPDKLADTSDIYLWIEKRFPGSREVFVGPGRHFTI